MNSIKNILAKTKHRPYALPNENWKYYQEWNHVLFLHWKLPFEIIHPHIPKNLCLDVFEGNVYVSLVAFTMQNIRMRNTPAISIVSDFEEINLRTYVSHEGKQGVYFLSIEAGKAISAWLAKTLSGLPYEKSQIKRSDTFCSSKQISKGYFLETEFEVTQKIYEKTDFDLWLTERYCLFVDHKEITYRYDVHHDAWKLKNLNLKSLRLNYQLGNMKLNDLPIKTHFSEGIKVLAWKKIKL